MNYIETHILGKVIEQKEFSYVIFVYDRKEAENIAQETDLTKEQFKYCYHIHDLTGFKLPSKKLLFINHKLFIEAKRRGLV